jgi:hypothetical protein
MQIAFKYAIGQVNVNPCLRRLGIAMLYLIQDGVNCYPPIEGRNDDCYRSYPCQLMASANGFESHQVDS